MRGEGKRKVSLTFTLLGKNSREKKTFLKDTGILRWKMRKNVVYKDEFFWECIVEMKENSKMKNLATAKDTKLEGRTYLFWSLSGIRMTQQEDKFWQWTTGVGCGHSLNIMFKEVSFRFTTIEVIKFYNFLLYQHYIHYISPRFIFWT